MVNISGIAGCVLYRQLRDAWRPSKSECHGSGMVRRLRKLENISGIAASLPLGVSVARQSVLPFGSPNKDTPIEVTLNTKSIDKSHSKSNHKNTSKSKHQRHCR